MENSLSMERVISMMSLWKYRELIVDHNDVELK